MINRESDLEKYYQNAKYHSSELTFFDDEIRFLKHVLEKYEQEHITEGQHISRVKLLSDRFIQLKFIKNNVIKDVLQFQGNIASILNESNVRSLDFVKLENDRIEQEIKDLHRFFKDIKKEIFGLFKALYQL